MARNSYGSVSLSIKEFQLEPTIEDLDQRIKRGQLAFGNAVGRDAQNYVPMKTGALRGSMKVEKDGKRVTWQSFSKRGYPYGVKQHRTQYMNYTTPGTGPHWEQKAQGIHYNGWVSEVGEAMR